jgi:hypothetical protein
MLKLTSQDLSDIREERMTAGHGHPPKLDKIASEIFLKIIELLHTARDLASVSKTCRRFRDLVARDGWRIFVQINFPSLVSELPLGVENSPTEWRDLARSLTTQSRGWDRRAVSAFTLYPRFWVAHLQSEGFLKTQRSKRDPNDHFQRWDKASKTMSPFRISREAPIGQPQDDRRPSSSRPQSTPFHPAIDTKLEFLGKLSSKKQTLVWSTGPEVYFQVFRSGLLLDIVDLNPSEQHSAFDDYWSGLNGFTVSHADFRSGINDVTSIKLMEPSTDIREYLPSMIAVDCIVGRASGHLHRYSISNEEPVRVVTNTFHSFEREGAPARRSVRSADINEKTRTSLMVACSDKVISLYRTDVETHDVWPITEFDIELDSPKSQAWTAKFSSDKIILLGLGHSPWPLHAYQTTPTGLVLTEKLGVQCDMSDSLGLVSNTVYAIEPVSGVSCAGGSNGGEIFLTGCYDGICK